MAREGRNFGNGHFFSLLNKEETQCKTGAQCIVANSIWPIETLRVEFIVTNGEAH